MTPERLAEIRAETADCYLQHKVVPNSHHVIWDLCDALTAAWSADWHGAYQIERERANRAEAAWHEEGEAHTETLAALARVRALCDEASEDCPAWDQYNVAALVADIRAAIEGKR